MKDDALTPVLLSVPVMDLDLRHLEEQLGTFESAGADAFHCAVADGAFVPDITCGTRLLEAVKLCTKLPCNVHLMTIEPGKHVAAFAAAGADTITVHAEACPHIHRVLGQIREAGTRVGVALQPTTPLIRLQYILHLVDRVLLLAAEPGTPDAPVLSSAFERVRILSENLRYNESRAVIETAGAATMADAARLVQSGAGAVVLDRATVTAARNGDPAQVLAEFRASIAEQGQAD